MRYAAGVFIVLHAMVHAMYAGQALRWFELREGMAWPLEARLLSSVSDDSLRVFAAIAIGITSVTLIAGGVGIYLDATWGGGVTVAAAIVLSLLHLLLRDGDLRTSPDQGHYGIIINLVIPARVVAG